MNTHADKTQEDKSQSMANTVSQVHRSSESVFQFVDNRPETKVQRELQEIANNSPQTKQAAQLQAIVANNSAKQLHREEHVRSTVLNPIQLRLYSKDSDLRNLVKEAAKTAQPNSTAILLTIYNEMRFEIDPTPGPFNSLVKARAAMITAKRIDAEDSAFLDVEAARMQQAGGDPAEALRLRILASIVAKRDGIEGKYGHHIFSGDYNSDGIPTGFHSKVDGSGTHEAYGGVTDVGNTGAYQQSVRRQDNQTQKPVQSTFFPDAANHANVIDAITVVYGYGLSTVAHVDASVNGMLLEKKGNTVFPAGGSDARFAE
jgi:hypothetical protein